MIRYLSLPLWPIVFLSGFVFLIGCTPDTTTDTTDDTTDDDTTIVVDNKLTVTVPNGGETWNHGATYAIKWDKHLAGGAKFITIELYKADELSITIESELKNDGIYNWEIPTTVSIAGDYKIRIQSVKPDSSQSDLSDGQFSIDGHHAGLTSSAFQNDGTIPIKYTCDGTDSSPPLTISGIPDEAKELVLFMDDLDGTPTATNTTTDWNHWVVYKIPVVSSIAAGNLPTGALVGLNDWNDDAYRGPCPPPEGSNRAKHKYRIRLYAIDTNLTLGPRSTRAEVVTGMENNILKGFTLSASYGDVTFGD